MNLNALGPVYAKPGPVLTACLDVSRDSENADAEIELRWRALREELSEQGATEPDLEAARERLLQVTGLGGDWGRIVVVRGAEILLDRMLPGRPRAHGRWGAFPSIAALLTAEAHRVAHLVVEVDRTGADITVAGPAGAWSETVEGDDHPVHKVGGGGWAHLRWQHSAENLWEDNARQVAERVDRLANASHAEIVAVAGDPRAVTLLRDAVAERTRPLLRVLEGGGRGENPEGRLPVALSAVLEERAAGRARDAAATFEAERGRGGRAAAGLPATVAALRRAQVETLLIPPNWSLDEPGWYGPDPVLLGLKSDDLEALGVGDPQQAPMDDLVIRAAVGTDASVTVIPDQILALDGEPCAILRFADASTPHE